MTKYEKIKQQIISLSVLKIGRSNNKLIDEWIQTLYKKALSYESENKK